MALMLLFPLLAGLLAQPPYPPPGRMVDIGGSRLHLYCTGEGSPTVMIMGAGLSTDWALVQPEVARFTRVCTYDPSGTAWSNPSKNAACTDRVLEAHRLIESEVPGPLVLVGYSLGAIRARMYLEKYPASVVGLVIVDHAIDLAGPRNMPAPMSRKFPQRPDLDSPPELISTVPIAAGLEDDPAFENLPVRSREVHRWAAPAAMALLTDEIVSQCMAQATQLSGSTSLKSMPLVVVSTGLQSSSYTGLQAKLVSLSTKGKQLVAARSGHGIIVDEPEVVVEAIRTVVAEAGK